MICVGLTSRIAVPGPSAMEACRTHCSCTPHTRFITHKERFRFRLAMFGRFSVYPYYYSIVTCIYLILYLYICVRSFLYVLSLYYNYIYMYVLEPEVCALVVIRGVKEVFIPQL